MHISFIRPNLAPARSSDAMTPLCFAVLAALTPPGHQTVLHDERLEDVPFDAPTDLVALTVETYTARRAYQIALEYRRRGVKVVMGGYHPTFRPGEALGFADAVVVGDAEGLWPAVVEDASRGRLRRVYRQAGYPRLDGVTPDHGIFRGKRYPPIALVQYGRGCRFSCEFCSIRAFYGASLRQRPVAEVIAEIEAAGRRHVFLVDDNLFVDLPRARELFTALAPLAIRWSCQVSIDVADDPGLVQLMAQSGCTTALVGFESLSPASLAQMRKAWNLKHGGYERALGRFRDAGIMVYGTFVFGYDGDTTDSFEATLEFALRHKLYLANFNPLTPTPGAALYDRLESERRLVHERWWLDPGFRYGDATFHPRGMSSQELTAGCYRARTRFNTWRSIGSRLLEPRAHLRSPYSAALFLASNVVSRREVHRKQGRALGATAVEASLASDLVSA